MPNSDLIKVLKKQKPSKIPAIITGASLAAKLASVKPENVRTDAKLMSEVCINFQKKTGMDWTIVYSDPLYVFEALGCEVQISSSGPLIEKKLGNEIFERFPAVNFHKTPSCKALFDAVEIVKLNYNKHPVAVLFEGPFTSIMRIYEPTDFLKMLIKEPEKAKKPLDSMVGVLCKLIGELKNKGVSIFYMPEPFASKDMVSFQHFKDFAKPYIKAVFDYIKNFEGFPILHVCGSTDDRWSELVETGALALSLDQKIDLEAAKKVIDGNIVLAGNVDPVTVLGEGSQQLVKDETEKAIRNGGPDSYILMPGCGVPPIAQTDNQLDNLKVMVQTGKNFKFS